MFDTVHILSRAVGESANEQCCHKNKCGLDHHVTAERSRFDGMIYFSACLMLY